MREARTEWQKHLRRTCYICLKNTGFEHNFQHEDWCPKTRVHEPVPQELRPGYDWDVPR